MRRRDILRATATTAALLLVPLALALGGCAPEPHPSSSTPAADASRTSSAAPDPTRSTTARPTPTPTVTPVAMPTDCRAILSPSVLAHLADVPLNDPAFGPSGVIDGGLTCIWGSPNADTTGLVTKITRMSRGPALDMLNALGAQGYTCYTPDGGTRCEKTWPNATYPVTDGRTAFWRDGILIDTSFSNLAPPGYTASIVAHVFG